MAKRSRKNESATANETYTIHLIAMASGDLLNGLARVAISQFPDVNFEVVSHPLLDTMEKLEARLDELSGERPIVLHALAGDDLKGLVRNKCIVRRIPQFDATGQILNFFAGCVGELPQNDVSRIYRFDTAYRRRIEAMEFALEHDDGLGIHSLREADIVIVGISRVSKSPTTLFLSARGYKVANVSIAPEVEFPEELEKISNSKIVAFTMQPKRLHEIRIERASRMGAEGTSYGDLQSVIREVMHAESEFRRRGYHIIDVTNLTIEQSAAKVLIAVDPSVR